MTSGSVIFWYWWVFGAALLIMEMIAPATFFLWMAVSAGIVGIVLWLIPSITFDFQLLLFAAISFIAILAFQLYRRRNPHDAAASHLNSRETQYLGQKFILEKPIVRGHGKIKIDDTIWRIEGVDAVEGAIVKVVGSRGNALLVETVAPGK